MVDDLRAVPQDGVQLVERVERVFVALETLVTQAYNDRQQRQRDNESRERKP